ncbi:MAG TPA: hypothetical protein DD379_00830 [Cyanobacteria bacterium UBA11162]|nr:hypothetical protein [Cyanobacteria bacterium UBA12227]HAX86647.1 hypothetical protein [Cyanobacteria bacterium UBA11370]HBL09990.1 hypothetical protein [Cyanobacteria bacterium UBA11162]HBY78455.1 hypothetical protein [Cyanobacteria bacterium UBA11148]
MNEPHIEIKTRYIYGNEVEKIIEKQTVIGLVSASSISKTGKQKLSASGIVCTENVPKSEFMQEE